jgi:hypothetical protein
MSQESHLFSEALEDLQDFFEQHSISWTLVGGLAISMRCAPRFTYDLDLIVLASSDQEAESIAFKLMQKGATVDCTVEQQYTQRLSLIRFQFAPHFKEKIELDFLFASSGIEAEIIARSETLEIFSNLHIPVASISDLIALKLLSVSPERMKDLVDLQSLKQIATPVDLDQAKQACVLITQRGYHRELDLVDRFERWVKGELPI